MKLGKTGIAKEEIFKTMGEYGSMDLEWREHKSWAYVYYPGPEADVVSKQAYTMFLSENSLDPTSFPSLLKFENEIVSIAKHHLRGGEDMVGNFTSGGTESILLSVKTARDRARDLFPHIQQPEMILPETAHAAFHKAATYFDIKIVPVPVDSETFRADVSAMEAAITENTILLVGSAVSYAHGVIDPIEEMGQLALKHNLLLHVDGCVGAWILPFYRKLGVDVPNFDFSVPGVTSISMDLHKYGFCPKGASLIMYKNKDIRKYQIFTCTNWTGYSVVNPTIQSSKSGGPVAAAWATLNFLGEEGYLKFAKDMVEGTERMVNGINAIEGLYVLGKPDLNMFGFTSDVLDVFLLMDRLKEKGWYVQPQFGYSNSKRNLHMSINPASFHHVDVFLKDLETTVSEVLQEKQETHPLLGDIDALINAYQAGQITDENIEQMISAFGFEGGGTPDTFSEINNLLDVLPQDMKKTVLTLFFNNLYTPAS